MTATEARTLPIDHIESLSQLERGYWWYVGRLAIVKRGIQRNLKSLGETKNLHYMDLGCGTGGVASQVQQEFHFKRAAAIDGDPQMLSHARKYAELEVHQVNLNSAFTLPFTPHIITALDVIEHLPQDEAFLDIIYKGLAPNGLAIFTVPAHPVLFSEWDRQLGHYRRYTMNELRTKLERRGFSLLQVRPMWSWLAPVGYVRKFRTKRYQGSMEFEKVPAFVNETLIQMAKVEDWVARFLPPPFGTSLVATAKKK